MAQQLRSSTSLLHHLRWNNKFQYEAGEEQVNFSLVVNVVLVLPAETVKIGRTEMLCVFFKTTPLI